VCGNVFRLEEGGGHDVYVPWGEFQLAWYQQGSLKHFSLWESLDGNGRVVWGREVRARRKNRHKTSC